MRAGKFLIASLCVLLLTSCGSGEEERLLQSETSKLLGVAPKIVVQQEQSGSDFRSSSEGVLENKQGQDRFLYGIYTET